jgi:hypothetical protein
MSAEGTTEQRVPLPLSRKEGAHSLRRSSSKRMTPSTSQPSSPPNKLVMVKNGCIINELLNKEKNNSNFTSYNRFSSISAETDLIYGSSFFIGIDGISIFFIILITFLPPISIFVGRASIQKYVKEYCIAFLVLETFILAVFCTFDLNMKSNNVHIMRMMLIFFPSSLKYSQESGI